MSFATNKQRELNGVGLGFRVPHLHHYFEPEQENAATIPWLEIMTDNYLNVGGFFAAHLTALSERYPLSFHGVGLSIGSPDGLDEDYLSALKKLVKQHQPVWVSDHLSWSNYQGIRSHDLLPLEYDEVSFQRIKSHVDQVQNVLNRPLMLENISAYIAHPTNRISEPEFLNRLCQETGCFILLDLNNLYVNQENLGLSWKDYLQTINFNYVKQLHLGGHEKRGSLLVDTHGSEICDQVWAIYQHVISQHGAIPTLIEWDNNLPEYAELLRLQQYAAQIMIKESAFTKEKQTA